MDAAQQPERPAGAGPGACAAQDGPAPGQQLPAGPREAGLAELSARAGAGGGPPESMAPTPPRAPRAPSPAPRAPTRPPSPAAPASASPQDSADGGDLSGPDGAAASSSLGFESDGSGASAEDRPAGRGDSAAGHAVGHYISTREIQLSQVARGPDADGGLAARCDFEDSSVPGSSVDDAASGCSDETPGAASPAAERDGARSCRLDTGPPGGRGAPSTGTPSPPPLPPGAGRAGPDRPWPEPLGAAAGPAAAARSCGSAEGQLRPSIKPAARAINGPGDARARRDALPAAGRQGDMRLRGPAAAQLMSGSPGPALAALAAAQDPAGADRASEPDDADEEVRSLTARAFRSLACPRGDAPDASSRASTLSEAGLARGSAFLDLKCGACGAPGARAAPPGLVRSAASVAAGLRKGGAAGPAPDAGRGPARRARAQALEFVVSKVDGEIEHVATPLQPPRLRPDGRGPGRTSADDGPGAREGGRPAARTEGPRRRSRLASSLLQDVISKKMQHEHELRLERGAAVDAARPGPLAEDAAGVASAGGQGGTASARSPVFRARAPREGGAGRAEDAPVAARATLPRSRTSAFRSWREEEPGPPAAGRATALSRLLVPGTQRAPPDKPPAPQAPEVRIRLGSVQAPGPDLSPMWLLAPGPAGPRGPEGGARAPRSGDGPERRFQVRDVRDRARARGPRLQVRDVRKLIRAPGDGAGQGGGPPEQGPAGPPAGPEPASPSSRAAASQRAGSADRVPEAAAEGTVLVHRASGRLPVATIAPSKPEQGSYLPVLRIVAKAPAPKAAAPKAAAGAREQEASEEAVPGGGALERLVAAVRSMDALYSCDAKAWKRRSDPLAALAGSHVLPLIASEERDGERDGDPAAPAGRPGEAGRPAGAAGLRPRGPPERLQRRSSSPGGAAAESVCVRAAAFGSLARARPRSLHLPAAPRDVPDGRQEVSLSPAGLAGRGPPPDSPPPPPAAQPPGPRALKISPAAPRKGVSQPERAGEGHAARREDPPAPSAAPLCSLPPLSARSQVPGTPRAPQLSGPSRPAWRTKPEPAGDRAAASAAPQSPERPPAAVYRPPPLPFALPGAQPQVLCLAPPGAPGPAPAGPPPPTDPFQQPRPPQTQRKMLLDVATGQYYLVDTPVQPATRRLLDPETGQFVDVPVASQQPAVAPVPLAVPPAALSPGAYAPTYLIYPGFLPTVLPPGALQPPPLAHAAAGGELPPGAAEAPRTESAAPFPEGPCFLASPASSAPTAAPRLLGAAGFAQLRGKPLAGVSSQPLGPRIAAAPAFDGSASSFAVEHR